MNPDHIQIMWPLYFPFIRFLLTHYVNYLFFLQMEKMKNEKLKDKLHTLLWKVRLNKFVFKLKKLNWLNYSYFYWWAFKYCTNVTIHLSLPYQFFNQRMGDLYSSKLKVCRHFQNVHSAVGWNLSSGRKLTLSIPGGLGYESQSSGNASQKTWLKEHYGPTVYLSAVYLDFFHQCPAECRRGISS